MLTIQNVSKKVDGNSILSNISLEFQKGEIFGLLGRNGSGKTTLLRLIMGVLTPDEGQLLYNEQSLLQNPSLKQNIQFMPVRNQFFDKFTYKELVGVLRVNYPKFDVTYANELMNRYKLPEDKKYRELSTGQKKQFSLIIAFASRPEVILLDEPTDGIDAVTRYDILELMVDEVASRETTLIITSHRLEDIERICNRIAFLEDHRISQVTDLDELKEQFVKVQLVFDEDVSLIIREKSIPILDYSGVFCTLLLDKENLEARIWLKSLNPKVWNEVPVNLEEVFIAKFGGRRRW
ncbi:ABC transporter ATP-binding protein [Bacillus suaedaesalsae]|uniref:ABC transporter ATP-binding protein n=1 Tax=Bacillus suaedaesalsae TaxID=2810349 RepID=A0ABS2DGJ1_9BACI|nr:ABC transporter ATP-binding protein [Bacillus suaedaesalsae]MBM6617579.1 ABC transporter ATP-binding protein [Bacillus suaedaesalsae]